VPADTPLVAIGGVALDTAPAVVAAGADAVAVISALGDEEGRALRASVRRWRGVWESP
jgi:thiamine monophosphate synthase